MLNMPAHVMSDDSLMRHVCSSSRILSMSAQGIGLTQGRRVGIENCGGIGMGDLGD